MFAPIESIAPPVIATLAVASTLLTIGSDLTEQYAPKVIEGVGSISGSVAAGSVNIVTWQIIKRTGCPGEVARTWSGKNGFYMVEPRKPATLPESDTLMTYSIQTKIPELAPVGRLELNLVGFYQCPGAPREDFTLGPVLLDVAEG